MDRGKLNRYTVRRGKRPCQLLKREVGLRTHQLGQEIHVRREFARRTRSVTLLLWRDVAPIPMAGSQPHSSTRADTEHPSRFPSRMPRRDIVENTLAKIQ